MNRAISIVQSKLLWRVNLSSCKYYFNYLENSAFFRILRSAVQKYVRPNYLIANLNSSDYEFVISACLQDNLYQLYNFYVNLPRLVIIRDSNPAPVCLPYCSPMFGTFASLHSYARLNSLIARGDYVIPLRHHWPKPNLCALRSSRKLSFPS